MKDDPVTDASLRQFLLGRLEDHQRQQIESLFLTDPEFKERILAVEQDLIEDFLDESLTKVDRESFLLHFAQTPEQQRNLRITKSVMEWAVRGANRSHVGPPPISVWSRLLAGLRLKPVFVISIAASAMVAIMVGLLWWNFSAGQQHLRHQEELVRLNDSANLRETLAGMYTLELSPVTVRSAGPEAELDRSTNQYVELRLRWIHRDYPQYRVTIRRFDDDESFTLDGRHAEGDAGKLIRLRLHVNMLKRGLYQIELSGIDPNGAIGDTAEYTFNVSG